LLNDCNLVRIVDHYRQVLVQGFLREANVQFLGAAHPVEIEELLTDDSISVKDLVELAQFEEEDLIEIVLLQLPVLMHARGELWPLMLWDMKRGRVIILFARPLSLLVLHVGRFEEVG